MDPSARREAQKRRKAIELSATSKLRAGRGGSSSSSRRGGSKSGGSSSSVSELRHVTRRGSQASVYVKKPGHIRLLENTAGRWVPRCRPSRTQAGAVCAGGPCVWWMHCLAPLYPTPSATPMPTPVWVVGEGNEAVDAVHKGGGLCLCRRQHNSDNAAAGAEPSVRTTEARAAVCCMCSAPAATS